MQSWSRKLKIGGVRGVGRGEVKDMVQTRIMIPTNSSTSSYNSGRVVLGLVDMSQKDKIKWHQPTTHHRKRGNGKKKSQLAGILCIQLNQVQIKLRVPLLGQHTACTAQQHPPRQPCARATSPADVPSTQTLSFAPRL